MKVEHFNFTSAEDKGLIHSGHLNCHKQREGGGGGIETTQSTLRGQKWTASDKKNTNTRIQKYT